MRHFFLFLFFSYFANSQQVSEVTAIEIFDNIIHVIGNNNPRPPSLIFKSSTSNPASYSPSRNRIQIEYKVLEICYSFGKDSLNALAYILAHEIGHHYQNHGWDTQYASLDFSDKINKIEEDNQQRVDDETQADVYAGFYAHLAGYNALSVAEEFLGKIYKEYSLPSSLPNYPTLSERKKIINKNKLDFEQLRIIFDVGNIAMSLGQYNYAQELFEYILNKGFTSREIYNNLGLCYAYEALDLDIEDNYNVVFPFKMDLSSRLSEKEVTRNMSSHQKAIQLLNNANKEFNTALELDPSYSLSKENIFYSQIALSHLGEDVSFQFTADDICLIDNVCKTCVNGHLSLINNKSNKAKKYFKKGSNHCNICSTNIDFKSKKIINQEENINMDFSSHGIDLYCIDFRSDDCDIYNKLGSLKMCVSNESYGQLIKLKRKVSGRSSCVSLVEFSSKENQIKNNVNIYIDDSVDEILNNYQNLRIINTGHKKYISIVGKQITFETRDNTVTKWYYYEDIN